MVFREISRLFYRAGSFVFVEVDGHGSSWGVFPLFASLWPVHGRPPPGFTGRPAIQCVLDMPRGCLHRAEAWAVRLLGVKQGDGNQN